MKLVGGCRAPRRGGQLDMQQASSGAGGSSSSIDGREETTRGRCQRVTAARPHSRDEMAYRFAALIRYCGHRRYLPPLEVIARGLNCSTRTVRRYLEALEQAGFDVPKWRNEVLW